MFEWHRSSSSLSRCAAALYSVLSLLKIACFYIAGLAQKFFIVLMQEEVNCKTINSENKPILYRMCSSLGIICRDITLSMPEFNGKSLHVYSGIFYLTCRADKLFTGYKFQFLRD